MGKTAEKSAKNGKLGNLVGRLWLAPPKFLKRAGKRVTISQKRNKTNPINVKHYQKMRLDGG